MFDVSWTDLTRETVGQRKNRKESKDHQIDDLTRVLSVKSLNSNGSQPQNWPSLLNLFGGSNAANKKSIKRTGSHSKLSILRNGGSTTKSSRRASSYTVSSLLSDKLSHTSPTPPTNFFAVEPSHSDVEQSSASDGDVTGSVFSGWTGRSGTTKSTWGSVMDSSSNQGKLHQSLSSSSFITQITEVTVSPRESVKADEQIATVFSILAPPSMPIKIREAPRRGSNSLQDVQFPGPNTEIPESTVHPPSPILGRLDGVEIGWPIPPQTRQSKSWKLPDAWECPDFSEPLSVSPPTMLGAPLFPIKVVKRRPPPLELSNLQRTIRRMDAASSKIVLERLKEEWLEVADASVYREMELEKQLWMLTALQHLKKSSADSIDQLASDPLEKTKSVTKLLSLYENHASASFLSAAHPSHRIHHISTSPISPTFYPNIHPLTIPTPTPHLPYASNLFTSIHAFSLPAVLPASFIPAMLRECHRTLRSRKPPPSALPFSLHPPSPSSSPSFSSSSIRTIKSPKLKSIQKPGAIHLTILDPAPHPDTLGPKLRTWLDIHLILNLERQFRCINPGRLFPIWLSDAGLRGDGSTIVNVQFFAVVDSKVEEEGIHDGGDAKLKRELKSVVGRMLWKEIWGPFVEGERWWWEDGDIVEECERLRTRWEYSVIEGVREG